MSERVSAEHPPSRRNSAKPAGHLLRAMREKRGAPGPVAGSRPLRDYPWQ
jgi:hypothetical protein